MARWTPIDGCGVGEIGVVLADLLDLLVEEALELLLELHDLPAGVLDDQRRRVVEEQRVEQVLDGDVLVPPPRRLVRGQREGDLDFGANPHHSSSSMQRRPEAVSITASGVIRARP